LFTIRKQYGLAAIMLGLACFSKVSNVLIAAIIFSFIFIDYIKNTIVWKERKSIINGLMEYLAIWLIFFISLIPLLLTNYLLFGNIFTTGYSSIVTLDENLNLMLLDVSMAFSRELWQGLYNLLFHPNLGMVEANPILIVSFIGMFFSYKLKHRLWAYMAITIILTQLIFFAKWDLWYATEFGNRFLMFSIVICSLFTGNILNLLINKKLDDPESSTQDQYDVA